MKNEDEPNEFALTDEWAAWLLSDYHCAVCGGSGIKCCEFGAVAPPRHLASSHPPAQARGDCGEGLAPPRSDAHFERDASDAQLGDERLAPDWADETPYTAQPLIFLIAPEQSISWEDAQRVIDGIDSSDLDFIDFALGITQEDGAKDALLGTRELLRSDLDLLSTALADRDDGELEVHPLSDASVVLIAVARANEDDEGTDLVAALQRLELIGVTDAAGLQRLVAR